MSYRGFDPIHRPCSNEAAPKLETLLSSALRHWKNLQVYRYKLEPRPEPSASAEDRRHINSERAELQPILFLRDPFSGQICSAPVGDLRSCSAVARRLIRRNRKGGVE